MKQIFTCLLRIKMMFQLTKKVFGITLGSYYSLLCFQVTTNHFLMLEYSETYTNLLSHLVIKYLFQCNICHVCCARYYPHYPWRIFVELVLQYLADFNVQMKHTSKRTLMYSIGPFLKTYQQSSLKLKPYFNSYLIQSINHL